jgi:hypothetical protein
MYGEGGAKVEAKLLLIAFKQHQNTGIIEVICACDTSRDGKHWQHGAKRVELIGQLMIVLQESVHGSLGTLGEPMT